MKFFNNLRLQTKLAIVLVFTSGLVLIVTCLAFVILDSVSVRAALRESQLALARKVGANCKEDLLDAFAPNAKAHARNELESLLNHPHVRAACLYAADGKPYSYAPEDWSREEFPAAEKEKTIRFREGTMELFLPIKQSEEGEVIGTLYLETSLLAAEERTRRYVLMAGGILTVAVLVAVFLSVWMQRFISRPILALASTAVLIAKEQNYSQRAVKVAQDEVGTLVDSFNEMLGQIQRRDTELHVARAAAEAAREDAEKANQLKSKFLSVMSHELRTPLSIIIQFLDMVVPEVVAERRTQWADWLSRSLGQAHHMLNQINDILDIARIEAGKMEVSLRECEVAQIVEGGPMSGMPYLMRRNNNRLSVECPADLGIMWTDLDKVQRCLINLLGNASKFTKNGTVSLKVRRWAKDGRDWVTFRVEDTGKGMTPEELAKLFRPFSQASAGLGQQFGGHGLGLAITKDLCQRLGGEVRAESVPGNGSVFIMELPATRPEHEPNLAVTPISPASAGTPAGGGCVLVIDDDPEMRRLLAEMLTREGFRVETAQGGEEGLRRAKELSPAAITLDVLMPEMDGWNVLGRLKADPELAAVPVVMISVWPERERAFALGVADYLSKPVDQPRLMAVLRKYYSPAPNNCALVVEDDPDMRSLFRKMLEGEKWEAKTAENGQEALEQIKRARPALIILDLMMPVMDGFQLVAELQAHAEWRRIPVIVISAKDLTAEDKQRLEGGVREVLKKGSFNREELLQTVRQTVRQFLPGPTPARREKDEQAAGTAAAGKGTT